MIYLTARCVGKLAKKDMLLSQAYHHWWIGMRWHYVKSAQGEKVAVKTQKDGINFTKKLLAAEINEDMLFADGFDKALIGYIERAGMPSIACYDKFKCIDILADDMSYEDAHEYFYFNVVGSYVGENTPCFLTTIIDEEKEAKE